MKTKINGYDITHINSETGEVICETKGCTSIEDNEITESERKKQDYLNSNEINFCAKVGFVKLHDDVVDVLADKLTPVEFKFFIRLSKFVSYRDCTLRRTSHGNSKIMDMKDMSELLDIDYSNVRKIVSSLKKKGVIGKHETGSIGIDSKMNKAYTVNPFIMFRGKDVNKTITEFYRNTGWVELLHKKDN